MVKMLFNKLLTGIKKYYFPRYNLSLDSEFFNPDFKKMVYRFKIYNNHSFAKFTFDDIMTNHNLTFDINPYDLLKIALREESLKKSGEQLKILEIQRNNQYKLANGLGKNIFSGDEICSNPLLIDQIRPIDIYKIAFNTGFAHGRQVHNEIVASNNEKPNLTLIKKQ